MNRFTMTSDGGLVSVANIRIALDGKSPRSPVRSLRPVHQGPLSAFSPQFSASNTTRSPFLNCKYEAPLPMIIITNYIL